MSSATHMGNIMAGKKASSDGSTECLIHPSLYKMASISQAMFADEFSWLKKICISIKNLTEDSF